jgi:phosphoribosyl-AMP cyclohydrolase
MGRNGKIDPMSVIDDLKYDSNGLIPAIIQDATNGEVLMMAWMNRESLQRTIDTGLCTYWSRSRQSFWVKGETSGHTQHVKRLSVDCDQDALLIQVEQVGAACHENYRSCFFRDLKDDQLVVNSERVQD